MLKKMSETDVPLDGKKLSEDAKSFLKEILNRDPNKRIGGYKEDDLVRGSVGSVVDVDDAAAIR